ncbi:predicted protein [Naegleria gruberi]|uniref:Predicted protein n=1 Tax=Naegleria gruberi TaxID=5762 RepID=D2UZ59_NAEGR|nr:uncharacterized protein NAEGRDRAFT_61821 [Naegleria gruberi]EFC49885.1 predicted protein [Naegleria gruberi]|eukprot:XP_002682629.1 predicted protein [Naegleria gruberi strain NEG-M]
MNSNTIQKDIAEVISNLQNHWNILEEELIEINKDIQYMTHCLKKYGESFRIPLEYLQDLKVYKKNAMRDIISTMETFTTNLNGGRVLANNLSHHIASSDFVQQGRSSWNPSTITPQAQLVGMLSRGEVVTLTTKKKANSPVHYKLITKKPNQSTPSL